MDTEGHRGKSQKQHHHRWGKERGKGGQKETEQESRKANTRTIARQKKTPGRKWREGTLKVFVGCENPTGPNYNH